MFIKRKKFKVETTPVKRLSDRWDQQVFFITRKFPHSEAKITAIVSAHSDQQGTAFIPSEAALLALETLCSELHA